MPCHKTLVYYSENLKVNGFQISFSILDIVEKNSQFLCHNIN